MRAIGLDIGTTTLSAVLIDGESGEVLESLTLPSDAAVAAEPWARLQNPHKILGMAEGMLSALMEASPGVGCIGLTGQMHGILYANKRGEAISELFTWQDGRGDLPMQGGLSYAQALSERTGHNLATGYGAVTHFYQRERGLVPDGARSIMTIHDYIGMKLTGRSLPLTHTSDAMSFGAPDEPGIAPLLTITDRTALLGETSDNIPVAVAIGDNQASFLGSVQRSDESVLVNVGTGGQISMAIDGDALVPGCETRPYVDGASLLVGFSLCGGRAYALLETLFRQIAQLAGAGEGRLYEQMNALARLPLVDPLHVSTLFCGTRMDPSLRGAISGISTENLTAAHLVQGVLRGMAQELHAPYASMCAQKKTEPRQLVGSGNGIRKNPGLRHMLEQTFDMALVMPQHEEEAAYGAALFALAACGAYPSVKAAQRIIRYQP